MLTLLRDPYVLVAAGNLCVPTLPHFLLSIQNSSKRSLKQTFFYSLPTRSPLLLQHGGGHARAHLAHLDDANHVLPQMAAW